MAQVERLTSQRVQNHPASRPLPAFEMPWLEVVDPDRTLKRRVVLAAPSANVTEEICAEDVLEVVRVAGVSADSTQEIAAEDVIGVIPLRARAYPSPRITVVPEPLAAAPRADRADLARLETPAPSSIAPVAMDSFVRSHSDSTFSLEDTPYGLRMPRMGLAIAGGLGAMIGIFVLVFALGSAGAKPVVQMGAHALPSKPVAAAAPQSKAPSDGARSAVPTVDVSSLPRAPVGTLSLAANAAGHRLFVDGTLVSHGSAVVSCGKHLVKIGSKGRMETVDVPCGADVVVGP